jgi:hypothetical protein
MERSRMTNSILPRYSNNVKIRPIRVEGDVAFVPLSCSAEAVIDADDVPLVSHRNWFRSGGHEGRTYYAQTYVSIGGGKTVPVSMHRVLLAPPDDLQIDHINGNGLDNRRSNLRLASMSQNLANRPGIKVGKSGYRGVWYDAKRKKYCAFARINGVNKMIGRFTTAVDAAVARDRVAKQQYGEFAVLNFERPEAYGPES